MTQSATHTLPLPKRRADDLWSASCLSGTLLSGAARHPPGLLAPAPRPFLHPCQALLWWGPDPPEEWERPGSTLWEQKTRWGWRERGSRWTLLIVGPEVQPLGGIPAEKARGRLPLHARYLDQHPPAACLLASASSHPYPPSHSDATISLAASSSFSWPLSLSSVAPKSTAVSPPSLTRIITASE